MVQVLAGSKPDIYIYIYFYTYASPLRFDVALSIIHQLILDLVGQLWNSGGCCID
jgi:hypothetical protein